MEMSQGLKRKLHRLRVEASNGRVQCSPELWAKMSKLVAQKIENWSDTVDEWNISLPCTTQVVNFIDDAFDYLARDDELSNLIGPPDGTDFCEFYKTIDYLQPHPDTVNAIVDRTLTDFFESSSVHKQTVVKALTGTDIIGLLAKPDYVGIDEEIDLELEKPWIDLLPDEARSPDGMASQVVQNWMRQQRRETFADLRAACKLLGMTDRAVVKVVIDPTVECARCTHRQSFVWGVYKMLLHSKEDVKDLWEPFHSFREEVDPVEWSWGDVGSTSHWYFLWNPESTFKRKETSGTGEPLEVHVINTEEANDDYITVEFVSDTFPQRMSCGELMYHATTSHKEPINVTRHGNTVMIRIVKNDQLKSIKIPTVLRLTVHW